MNFPKIATVNSDLFRMLNYYFLVSSIAVCQGNREKRQEANPNLNLAVRDLDVKQEGILAKNSGATLTLPPIGKR